MVLSKGLRRERGVPWELEKNGKKKHEKKNGQLREGKMRWKTD